ncbi:hypothetical protein [Burkholderia sp. BCC1993]|uniref:hypothetical protein n=1 Tax=Burkholderia sp. BCC1993 TaxID=2817444 RepID=UPI002AB28A9C|nr:hypothetical protein [Burkholderia sp. BCC1993]
MDAQRDVLSSWASGTMLDAYNHYIEIAGDISKDEFARQFITPTRDTGMPRAEDIYFEWEREVKCGDGISGIAAQVILVRMTCAFAAESVSARLTGDRDKAWDCIVQAQHWVGRLSGMRNDACTSPLTSLARKGGFARHANDPKQTEKAFVRQCWTDWQMRSDSYSSKAAFARDMLTKCEHLTSTKVIEDWCREWDEEKRHPASTLSSEQEG